MTTLMRLYRRWRSRRKDRELLSLIQQSGIFDTDYYLKNNPDVASAGLDPLRHYLDFGRHEGRAPSRHFDGPASQANPSALNTASSRQVILDSGLFNLEYYRAANSDVALSGQDLIDHYLNQGQREGRRPSLDFDPNVYLAQNPDLQRANVDPILHYIQFGRAEGRCCRPPGMSNRELREALARLRSSDLFDAGFYLRQCPALSQSEIDPLLHYLVAGISHYVDPSPIFSTFDYLRAHPEVQLSGANPLLHQMYAGADDCLEEYLVQPDNPAASGARPYDSITFERKAGVAYFARFQFPWDPVVSPGKYASDAIADLVRRSPRLTVDSLAPDVSIIIPVFGQLHFVLSCLDSLTRQISRFSAEIIVADDASPEAAGIRVLQTIPWLKYRRRESNGGFVDTCNDAARIACGRFLVFLNSDTRVAEGWLDELVGSFDLFPKAALIGSSLFNADGSLQEAGGIYWRDGSAWNYGRNGDPNHPKYCFARQVDYVSGASIAIPAHIWQSVNGFDELFRPAYCEDADLAFRLREAGHQVWLQPLSRVLHYEGKTHGRDLLAGVKRHQTTNMRRLAKRWEAALEKHRPNGQQPDQEANRMVRDRILVLDEGTPMPDRDSGSFITFRMLRAFQSLGYQITFIPQQTYQYDKTYTAALQRLGIECLYVPYFGGITDVLDYQADFDLVLAYRFNVLADVYEEIRRRVPAARIIFHNVDLHFLREEREAALTGSRRKKIAAAMTRSAELELIAKVDCTIVHTKVEAAIIKKHLPIRNIVEFPYIAEIHRTQVPFEDRDDLLFLGGFTHPPNADAVKHFVRCVWPILSERLPSRACFVIVGSSPPADIRALAGVRVVVAGHVAELRDCFDRARVFVAPIRYGAGIKGKVIQALCYGAPSVITAIAAEGIGLVSGLETVIADSDAEFAEQVLAVYSDSELWYSLQAAGYKFIEEKFSWHQGLDLLSRVLDTADETWLARHEQMLRSRLDKLTGPG